MEILHRQARHRLEELRLEELRLDFDDHILQGVFPEIGKVHERRHSRGELDEFLLHQFTLGFELPFLVVGEVRDASQHVRVAPAQGEAGLVYHRHDSSGKGVDRHNAFDA